MLEGRIKNKKKHFIFVFIQQKIFIASCRVLVMSTGVCLFSIIIEEDGTHPVALTAA